MSSEYKTKMVIDLEDLSTTGAVVIYTCVVLITLIVFVSEGCHDLRLSVGPYGMAIVFMSISDKLAVFGVVFTMLLDLYRQYNRTDEALRQKIVQNEDLYAALV